MAFTYDESLSRPIDQLRFLIEDTDEGLPYYQDGELEWLLSEWMPRNDSVYYVAAIAADKLATKFAAMPDVSADGVSVSLSSLSRQFRELAANLRETYKASQVGGEIDMSSIMVGTRMDPSIRPLRFGVGMHDNPEVGAQDYGGVTPDPYGPGGTVRDEWFGWD